MRSAALSPSATSSRSSNVAAAHGPSSLFRFENSLEELHEPVPFTHVRLLEVEADAGHAFPGVSLQGVEVVVVVVHKKLKPVLLDQDELPTCIDARHRRVVETEGILESVFLISCEVS